MEQLKERNLKVIINQEMDIVTYQQYYLNVIG